ncbi:MAG: hypothetical protein ACRDUX_26645 [Mycobacterium sp.]
MIDRRPGPPDGAGHRLLRALQQSFHNPPIGDLVGPGGFIAQWALGVGDPPTLAVLLEPVGRDIPKSRRTRAVRTLAERRHEVIWRPSPGAVSG